MECTAASDDALRVEPIEGLAGLRFTDDVLVCEIVLFVLHARAFPLRPRPGPGIPCGLAALAKYLIVVYSLAPLGRALAYDLRCVCHLVTGGVAMAIKQEYLAWLAAYIVLQSMRYRGQQKKGTHDRVHGDAAVVVGEEEHESDRDRARHYLRLRVVGLESQCAPPLPPPPVRAMAFVDKHDELIEALDALHAKRLPVLPIVFHKRADTRWESDVYDIITHQYDLQDTRTYDYVEVDGKQWRIDRGAFRSIVSTTRFARDQELGWGDYVEQIYDDVLAQLWGCYDTSADPTDVPRPGGRMHIGIRSCKCLEDDDGRFYTLGYAYGFDGMRESMIQSIQVLQILHAAKTQRALETRLDVLEAKLDAAEEERKALLEQLLQRLLPAMLPPPPL